MNLFWWIVDEQFMKNASTWVYELLVDEQFMNNSSTFVHELLMNYFNEYICIWRTLMNSSSVHEQILNRVPPVFIGSEGDRCRESMAHV